MPRTVKGIHELCWMTRYHDCCSEVHVKVTGQTCSGNGRACNVQQGVDSAQDSALGEVQVEGHVLICIHQDKSGGIYDMTSAKMTILRT